MLKCSKRQRELIHGELHHRCINKEHGEYLEIVTPDVCEACPFAKIIKLKKPCKQRIRPQPDAGMGQAGHSLPDLARPGGG